VSAGYLPVLGTALRHGPWVAGLCAFALTPGSLVLIARTLERRWLVPREQFAAVTYGDPLLAVAVGLGTWLAAGSRPHGLTGPAAGVAAALVPLGFGLTQWRAELGRGYYTRAQAVAPTKIWHQLVIYPVMGYWLWTSVAGGLAGTARPGAGGWAARALLVTLIGIWTASNVYDRGHPKLGHPPFEWRHLRPQRRPWAADSETLQASHGGLAQAAAAPGRRSDTAKFCISRRPSSGHCADTRRGRLARKSRREGTVMIKLERNELPQEGTAFVVMPYGTKTPEGTAPVDFDELYARVYAPTISKCGMKPVRADHIWGCAQGILDVIWRGIQTAEVVVVDCTARSIDVGLELGLAMALGKRLVVTAQRLEDIPTDLRGHLRPVLYQVEGLGITTLTSGLEAELQAVRTETVIENTFTPLSTITGELKPGRVLAVLPDSAVVEADGELLHLPAANVTYAKRITDMTHVCKPDDRLNGAIITDVHGKRCYTLLVDKPNPWPTIQSDFPVGHTFTGRVTNVKDGVGAWVSLTMGINGHIPAEEARQAGLQRFDDVEAEVAYVDAEARRVGLHLRARPAVRTVPEPRAAHHDRLVGSLPPAHLPAPGQRLRGWVVRTVPDKGFVLLELEGHEQERPALLHIRHMLPELKADLQNGKVEADEEVFVEVRQVRRRDNGRWDVELSEIPEGQAQLAA
jgi:hypothetical protein